MRKIGAVTVLTVASLVASAADTVLLPRDNSGRRLPVYNNGFTLFLERTPAALQVYDKNGTLAIDRPLSLPDASIRSALDAAAAPDGSVVVAATAVTASEDVAYLLWLSRDGRLERATRVSPFFPARIAFGPGGTLLAAGKLTDGTSPRELPQHDVVREYDRSGKLIRTHLPSASFGAARAHPCAACYIVSNAKRAGLYAALANEYVEFDASGIEVGRWSTSAIPEFTSITGAALTDSGEFYIGGGYAAGYDWHVTVFRLDKATGTFVPVEFPPVDPDVPKPMTLLGAAGDRLVLYGKPTSTILVIPK